MKIFYTKDFVKMLDDLPKNVQRLYLSQEEILKANWRDPRLHIKKLKGKPITFSFRITRAYRAFFFFRSVDEIVLYAIADRKDAYRKHR